jgi:hypothetical protein
MPVKETSVRSAESNLLAPASAENATWITAWSSKGGLSAVRRISYTYRLVVMIVRVTL